jgi:hypothetical protein
MGPLALYLYLNCYIFLQVLGPAPTVIFPEPGGNLETSRSTLELEADSATFRDTKLKLRCEASLFKLYRRSSEELELHEDTPQLASVLGPSIAGEVISCLMKRLPEFVYY